MKEYSNKELLEFLIERVPALWNWVDYVEDPKPQDTKEHLIKTMESFLSTVGEPDYSPGLMNQIRKECFFPPLSARQICCATAVSGFCSESTPHVDLALHEFMDCIDNYGDARSQERCISPEEHLLYWTLATTILITIKYALA